MRDSTHLFVFVIFPFGAAQKIVCCQGDPVKAERLWCVCNGKDRPNKMHPKIFGYF